jgi:hypothetical protein
MHTDRSKFESTGHGTGGGSRERHTSSYHSDGVPEATGSEQSAFSGTFECALADWIQLVQMRRQDAVVNVRTHDGKVGTLWCRDGDIIDAACDGLIGEDAVIRALAWQGGKVSVEFESIDRRRQIQTGTSGLLLRAAYIHDVVQEEEEDHPCESLLSADADDATTVEARCPEGQYEAQDESQLERPHDFRRPFDLRFVAAGGLSALLIFGGLAWKWIYVPSLPSDEPQPVVLRDPPRSQHLTLAPPTTVPAATAGAPAANSIATRASASASLARATSTANKAKPTTTNLPPARRHIAPAAKRISVIPSTWAAASVGEGKRTSVPPGARVDIIRDIRAQPRVQVIEERQPRVQIIEDREPRISEPHIDEIR